MTGLHIGLQVSDPGRVWGRRFTELKENVRRFSRRHRKSQSTPNPPRGDPALGPPGGWIGVPIPLDLVLIRTQKAFAVLQRFIVYANGARFELGIQHADRIVTTGQPGETLSFTLDVLYDDRRGAASFGAGTVSDDFEHGESEGPRLRVLRGSGGPNALYLDYWLWPLPDKGSVRFAIVLPDLDLTGESIEIDSAILTDAASRAQMAWRHATSTSDAGGIGLDSG